MGARLQFTKPLSRMERYLSLRMGELFSLCLGCRRRTSHNLWSANDKGEEPPIANDEVATNDEVVAEAETNDEVDLVPYTLADDNSAAVNNGAVLATTMMMVVVFGITLLL